MVTEYKEDHPITADLINIYTFFPVARSVDIKEDAATGSYNLAKTSSSSWARHTGTLDQDNVEFDPATDTQGPLNIMAVNVLETEDADKAQNKQQTPEDTNGQIQKYGKIIVIGDSNFASNTYFSLAGNKDLFLNALNWLAEEHSLISVRKKEAGINPMTLTNVTGTTGVLVLRGHHAFAGPDDRHRGNRTAETTSVNLPKKTVFWLITLVAISGGFYLIDEQAEDANKATEASLRLFPFELQDIHAFWIKSRAEGLRVKLEKQGESWWLTHPLHARADEQALQEISD